MSVYFDLLITISLLYCAILNLTNIRFKIKEFLLIILAIFITAIPILQMNKYLSIVPTILVIIAYVYMKTKKIIYSIAMPAISLVITVLCDYFVNNASIFLLEKNLSSSPKVSITYLIGYIVILLLIFLSTRLINLLFNKKITPDFMQLSGKFGVLIILSLLLTIVIFYTNIIFGSRMGFSKEVIQINGVLFFTYFVLLMVIMYVLIRSLTKEFEFKNKQVQFESLKEYTDNLENLYSDMRAFRHDYINILSSMVGYLENKDLDGLTKHFNENILPLGQGIESNNFKIGLLKNIQINEIKGIFSSKLIRAQELGIDVFIDIAEKINKIDMNIIDFCRISGILLDNAIEAALVSEKKSIKIALVNKKNSVLIAIINSCPKDMPPTYKMFQKGFSTKGENRGLGLSTVKELINNYQNVILDTLIEGNEFKQHLEISFTKNKEG